MFFTISTDRQDDSGGKASLVEMGFGRWIRITPSFSRQAFNSKSADIFECTDSHPSSSYDGLAGASPKSLKVLWAGLLRNRAALQRLFYHARHLVGLSSPALYSMRPASLHTQQETP